MEATFLFTCLMLVGTFFLGINDIQKKQILNRGMNAQVVLCVSLFGSSLVLGSFLVLTGIPVIEEGFWSAVGGTIVLNLISQNLFIRAFAVSDASLIAPLRLLIPLFVVATGYIFLREIPSIGGCIGIFITIVGLYVLLLPNLRISFSFDKGVVYAIFGSLLFAVSFPLDKIAITSSSTLFATTVIFFSLAILTTFWNYVWNRGFIADMRQGLRQSPMEFAGIALTGAGGVFLTNHALNYSLAVYASSLKRTQVFWTVLLAGTFLNESHIGRRLAATALLLGGILVTILFQ